MATGQDEPLFTLGPEDFPVPFGVDADTGSALPGVTASDLERIAPERRDVLARGKPDAEEHLAIADVDPNNLEEAGWCVLFASDVADAVKKALAPLLAHREA